MLNRVCGYLFYPIVCDYGYWPAVVNTVVNSICVKLGNSTST